VGYLISLPPIRIYLGYPQRVTSPYLKRCRTYTDPAFFGALGAADIVFEGKRIGVMGVVHPEVLSNYQLKNACSKSMCACVCVLVYACVWIFSFMCPVCLCVCVCVCNFVLFCYFMDRPFVLLLKMQNIIIKCCNLYFY